MGFVNMLMNCNISGPYKLMAKFLYGGKPSLPENILTVCKKTAYFTWNQIIRKTFILGTLSHWIEWIPFFIQ